MAVSGAGFHKDLCNLFIIKRLLNCAILRYLRPMGRFVENNAVLRELL